MKICVNGTFQFASQPALKVSNRAFRYGDGIFETMLFRDGKLPLGDHHFQRLFASIELLGYKVHFTKEIIRENISILCRLNQCQALARVRVTVYGGEGTISERDHPGYVIEALPLETENILYNSRGLHIGIYSGAYKSCDAFSNLKSASGLVYSLAAQHAVKLEWDDCLVLNSKGSIADSSIANVFVVRKNEIITPPLTDGCVNGVMRKFLIAHFPGWTTLKHFKLVERSLSVDELETADEIFLTNAIRGVSWVKRFNQETYDHAVSAEISVCLLQTIPG